MKHVAIIPARGGSKRLFKKNIRFFEGKPVIAYSIEAALQSNLFDEVMVSTEDADIAEISIRYGAKVPFMRSAKAADDFASTTDVILEVLDMYQALGLFFDMVTCIYSTAPFVTPQKLRTSFGIMKNKGFDSIFTVVAFSYPVQRGLEIHDGKMRMIYPKYKNIRSQDLSTIYHDAGQFYISKVDSFRKSHSFWGDNTGGIILSELEVQDLDTETDWILAEMKYRLMRENEATKNYI
ncbi:CMP-N-acetylneuraminic acid synthetase [Tannerella sp. oral taxon BU063 isolate Cell 6/7/9]|uniref:CMP-N-acetylneuraminic acid synthetase n=5 Tax=Tannerella serpentiformis TaxID=712710 RepID=W2CSA7_9BACT|nr:CMP-N-acetylneuraminic acid synthetase [Tannerella sp. oral taxon BU063 isolate Cell 1/3]ETK10711.1 CMP-N-acetylneuraminic acid synthetase [Tannerella sp. oral taxon BU063 isolate Cell 6/7/9]ETK13028.1 CMP-N-acetylneuraminic acid synthetase [Tannerella sp. oral taxon BU063 isolate Cell 8/11]